MTDTPAVSVIICTRNRSSLLAETFQSLLHLPGAGPRWELVVVDNASTDDTLEVVRAFESQLPRPVRLVREDELGLSAARNRGILESRGHVLAFLDDDAFPEPSWLASLTQALEEDGVYGVGGPVEPQFRSPLPDWFSDRFLPYLTVWDLGSEPIRLRYNEYPRGANMAFRRETFDRFGMFSTDLGRKARSLLSCEETELCLRIERGGGGIQYVPAARVEHVVEGDRVTPSWLIQRFRAQGTSEAIVEWQHAGYPGLAIGSKRNVTRAVRSLRAGDAQEQIVRRCELAGARGYLLGACRAPFAIRRYKPSPEAGPARRWRPFR